MSNPAYQQYLKSQDWAEKRARKRHKNSRCTICGATEQLDVHHLNYRNLYDVKMSDLRVLCRRCHFKAHDLMKQGVVRFRKDSHEYKHTYIRHAVRRAIGLDKPRTPRQFIMFRSREKKEREERANSCVFETRMEPVDRAWLNFIADRNQKRLQRRLARKQAAATAKNF